MDTWMCAEQYEGFLKIVSCVDSNFFLSHSIKMRPVNPVITDLCGTGESNPTFLAAEGSSTRPRILGATCRSAAEARESWRQAVGRYLIRSRILGF